MAVSFEKEIGQLFTPACYYEQLPEELLPKRDKMAAFLSEVGMVPTIPEGGYFMVADFSHLGNYSTTWSLNVIAPPSILTAEFICVPINNVLLSFLIQVLLI